MPYPGVPEDKTDEMERCVADLMDDKEMKEKYPDKEERKEHAIAICHDSITGKAEETSMEKKKWSTKYINDLPDSAFAYIEPGGEKDEEGKTTPRSLRHLPYKDKEGNIDPAHVRNALARLPQTDIPEEAKEKARRKLVAAAKEVGIEVSEKADQVTFTINTKKISPNNGREIINELLKSFNTKGKEVKTKVSEKEVKKNEEEVVEEEAKEDVEVESEDADEEDVVKKADEKDTEEEVTEEESAEEEEVEKAEESDEEEDESADEEEEEVEKAEESDEEAEEEEDEEESDEAEKAQTVEVNFPTGEMEKMFAELGEKVDNLGELLKSAPAEGASDEETPEEEDEKPKEEETKKVEDGASSEGADQAELLKTIESLTKRVEQLEDSPAPSPVVVSKVSEEEEDEDSEVSKIQERLDELHEIRKNNPGEFTPDLQTEAFRLLDRKNELQRGY